MASPEDVATRFGLDSSHLNKPCTEAFFLSFSDHVHPWRLVFADLLSQTDLDDIDSEQTGCSEKEKRIASLRKWKTRRGNEATFRAIIEAVLSNGNVDSAEALCKIIAGRKTELSHDQPLSTVNQPSESTVAMTRTNEEKIRAQFIALVQRVQAAVEAGSEVRIVRNYLTMFFKRDLPDTTEMHKLFEAVSLQNLWNYQHHSPLESVADHFLSGNQEIEKSIKEYKARLSGFYVATKLVDFIESKELTVDDDDDESDDQQPPVLSPKQYRRLKVVLNLKRKITELSLEYVHKLWSSFAEEYDIPSLTIVLERVASGSLVITWIIPTHLADKILPRSKFFRDHGIVHVSLDGQSIYDEEEMVNEVAYEESFLAALDDIATADINFFSFFLKQGIDPNICDEEGCHPLAHATYCGRQDLVELLIEHGADVDLATKDEDGDTPLVTAVRSGNYQMVELLLLKGAKVNKTNKTGYSPYWLASHDGHSDIASLLLQHHAEVDLPATDADNEVPFLELCLSMATADIDLLSFFLKEGVDPNVCDTLGKHPLFYTTDCNRQDVVELLIEHGADVDLATKDEHGDTPLITAVRSGNYQMVELLLLKGAKVNKTNEKGQSPLQLASRDGRSDIASLLLQHYAEVDLPSDEELGDTPLCIACVKGHLDVATVLVQNGADVNYEDKEGATPLGYASQFGHTELVELLLAHGADVNKGVLPPLRGASYGGHVDTAKLLVRRGAEVDGRTDHDFGSTPLMMACERNHFEFASFLIENGADVNLQTKNYGLASLHLASGYGHPAVVKLLLESGAQLEIKDKDGRTPLMLAAWAGQWETVTELLGAGAHANTQDQEGLTALMLATQNAHLEVVEVLLEAGADPDITDNTAGWSAVFFAAKSGRLEIIQRLLRRGARVDIRDKNGLTPDEVTDQQDIREEIKLHCLSQSETEASEEREAIEVAIQEQPKEIEEERRGLVKESYQRLVKIFDALEGSLLPGRKEKKLRQQRKKMHSDIGEPDQELTSKD